MSYIDYRSTIGLHNCTALQLPYINVQLAYINVQQYNWPNLI